MRASGTHGGAKTVARMPVKNRNSLTLFFRRNDIHECEARSRHDAPKIDVLVGGRRCFLHGADESDRSPTKFWSNYSISHLDYKCCWNFYPGIPASPAFELELCSAYRYPQT